MKKPLLLIEIAMVLGIVFYMSGCTNQQDQTSDTPFPVQFTAITPLPDA